MTNRYPIPAALAPLLCVLLAISALARADQPRDGRQWYLLGRHQQAQEQYDAASDAYRHAIDLHFQPAGALMRMAQVTAAQGHIEEALQRLRQAHGIAPSALALLPQMGGIPALAGNADFKALMAKADAARYPCRTRPESAQFDFWLGSWTVTNPRGQVVGHNRVTRELSGCVVREAWTSAYGDKGTSVNFYDPASGHWHQVWTSSTGTVTHYVGDFSGGAMRFTASGFGDADGRTHFRRMTFTPGKDGTVRQHIEDSDDGKHWTTSFDGIYRKDE